jgi:Na+-translocating ferredoxin:NAD+ oxidoreductase RnfA subunit
MAQAIEGRAFSHGESPAALFALVTLVLAAVNDNIALADVPSGRTG